MSAIKRVVAQAQKRRTNRVYYEKCFTSTNLKESGIIQDELKSCFDRVCLDETKNEYLRYYGIDQGGSYFDLSLSILSLYPNSERPKEESKWRLASVELVYIDSSNKCRYSYETRQLLDYSHKRQNPLEHESKNVYRIGSLSIEIVLPFSLTRILFNGFLTKSSLSGDANTSGRLVSAKLSISTHPTCDKFDFQNRFDSNFLAERIEKSCTTTTTSRQAGGGGGSSNNSKLEAERLLKLILEDRIDTPLMYQGQIETLDAGGGGGGTQNFMMWGAKVKRFAPSGGAGDTTTTTTTTATSDSEPIEDLFIWSKCGHLIHLSRPINYKQLVNGMVHSSFDYPSHLCALQLLTTTPGAHEAASESSYDLNDLGSFAELKEGMKITMSAFESKQYEIIVTSNRIDTTTSAVKSGGLIELKVNDFEAWAICRTHRPASELGRAQSALWALDIHDSKFAFRLASESLLGGKGNSLIELNRLATAAAAAAGSSSIAGGAVSVPRGIVVSCVAYQLWLSSSPLIARSIRELDNTRRALSARSVFTNPLSDRFMPLAASQRILRDQCKKTCLVLNSCPLPQALVRHLKRALSEVFTDQELRNPPSGAAADDAEPEDDSKYKLFAVRSSALGEDSLETSAAGQMRTILNARGFDSIVRSIVDCWSSQFELEAVVYKSQNGLDFNLPMAVVVQELINCKAAGVGTTCDPLTGAKSRLQILANEGLGEGVVSGQKTDTFHLSLECLAWNEQTEEHLGYLSKANLNNNNNKDANLAPLYTVTSDGDGGGERCLSDEQIIDLANLLLWLRRNSQIRDREIEWGLTEVVASDESSSASSASSDQRAVRHQIHLLQSRPLTHLARLSLREIDHELDYGFASPLNAVSRANLGEVMPGALCALTSTYFMPVCTNFAPEKPFVPEHTYKSFAANSFAFYAQLACMVLTHTDSITRFGQPMDGSEETAGSDATASADLIRTMIGTTEVMTDDAEMRLRMLRDRINPVSRFKRRGLLHVIALDSGVCRMLHYRARRLLAGAKFESNLTSIESYIEQLERPPAADSSSSSGGGGGGGDIINSSGKILDNVERDIEKLFARLVETAEPLCAAWFTHMRATIVSMALNMICMKILSREPAYPDSVSSSELLNDFSILMQGGQQRTESGNISNLLNELIQALIDEGSLEQVRHMDSKQLYNYLAGSGGGSSANSKGATLFNEFMKKNGHRSFKEFDYSTLTWADDPSYIIKSLMARLKHFKLDEVELDRRAAEQRARERDEKLKEILSTKITRGKAILTGYVLPRARNATIRREESKSFLIKAISIYRDAFRHLAGLLCLAGRLPSADLIFHLSIEELESFVHCRNGRADLARMLYKCRRRQQRARVLSQITYPKPVLKFDEMLEVAESIYQQQPPPSVSASKSSQQQQPINGGAGGQVSGMTSCAGCVTGRACVVNSLDDMDQIEPNDILITYSIDISWSVYFFTLAGIVTELGGIVSHGAVVAREYGIPTLCTAVGACSLFKTGQIVTLDANQGICYVASGAGAATGTAAASATLDENSSSNGASTAAAAAVQ